MRTNTKLSRRYFCMGQWQLAISSSLLPQVISGRLESLPVSTTKPQSINSNSETSAGNINLCICKVKEELHELGLSALRTARATTECYSKGKHTLKCRRQEEYIIISGFQRLLHSEKTQKYNIVIGGV